MFFSHLDPINQTLLIENSHSYCFLFSTKFDPFLGKMIITDEGVYKGYFKDNKLEGFGEFSWYSGKNYIGEWSENLMHGKGKLVYPNKDVYEGEFFKGVRQGQGKFTNFETMVSYEGPWVYGKQHGVGCVSNKSGKKTKALYGDGTLVQWIFDEEQDLGPMPDYTRISFTESSI